MIEEATQAAYVKANGVKIGFEQFAEKIGSDIGKEEVAYYFKITQDDYTICVRSGNVWYNNTVLSVYELSLEENRQFVSGSAINYFPYYAEGRELMVFYFLTNDEFEVYHVVDISYVYDKLYLITAVMAGASAVITFLSIVVMSTILKRAFVPLKQLSASAKNIAAGAYSERVTVNNDDEIGMLGKDFNTMAEAVERHTKEIEESEEKKTLFMGNLTHELKTPLTAISGYAQTMRTVQLSDEDKDEALTYIYEESGRLDRLSKKMMRLLELDRKVELAFRDVSIEELFATAQKTCSAVAAEKDIRIDIGDCVGTVRADFDLMCDVIVNLLDNAVKASPVHSVIKLYTEDGTIVVQDFGCGIADEEIEKILEPFYMVDKSRSRKSGGAGLGLALVSLILRHHGMSMRIESEVGEGTRMIIYNSIKSR